jgi:hypothetical protein
MRNILHVQAFYLCALDSLSHIQTGTITAALVGINLRIFRQRVFES